MKSMTRYLFTVVIVLFFVQRPLAQTGVDSSTAQVIQEIPAKYFDQVSKKAGGLEEKLDKKSMKALAKFEKTQGKLKRKLSKVDSAAATAIFAKADNRYKALQEKLKGPRRLKQYIPGVDSMGTSLDFIKKYGGVAGKSKELENSISKVGELKNKLQQAEDIKQFMQQQKQYLKESLQKFGFAKQLQKLNKQAYYYNQQLKAYKETLKDPQMIERKTLDLLSQTDLYKNFMKKNSMLGSLFKMPSDDPTDPAYLQSLAGLQTSSQVDALVMQQAGAGGASGRQLVQQNIGQAQTQLQQLKNKVSSYGNSSSDDDMPDFKPNPEKTKTFFQRLELGSNMQTQKSNSLFPVTSDVGLSAGYKISGQNVIGLGASYKMGWGSGIRDINITSQGAGLRSFMDWKIKKTLWISGGYELNHLSIINSIEQLKNMSAWQQSGLIGFSKKLPVKTGFIKNTKLQLLWDFLSYQQVPRAQPIVFRVGYSIK